MSTASIFMHHLTMAICEWFLMFVMFIAATLGFVLTKFAHHYELQTPCLFCFKSDHVFGKKPGYYLNLFCKKHQAEVSCLLSCEIHEKLVDVKEMCDDCFMLIMKQNEFSKPYLNKNFVRKQSSLGLCSCCKIQWKSKSKPPMPCVTGWVRVRGPYCRRNNFKRVRDRISGKSSPFDKLHMDTVSDSGCADLYFYSGSDSESEDSFYDIECGENECYEPSFQNGPRNLSDKREDYEYSETHGVGENDLEKPNGPGNGSDRHEGYEYSETHSVGENDVEKRNGPHNGTNTYEGYENSETHSVGENDMEKPNGPRNVSYKHEGCKYLDINSVGEIENDVEKRNGPDKHEGYENSETHSLSENDGETEIEKLKRKLENEQQRLFLLNKELEEERNASAIAADEAMAMITRLQEEKAALHMEASQYLRMMDEQAEYDMDALDKANDLITQKDKEIQDLEAELEYFRNRYENELFNGNYKSYSKYVLVPEDEKKYILRSLAEVELKFHQNFKDSLELNGGKNEADVENEILNLNERLEALESDRDFIEHACNMVESHGGVQFIQEIAQHLCDLRRVRFD